MAIPTTTAPTLSPNEVYTPNVASALSTLGTTIVADLNALFQGGTAGTSPEHLARVATTAALPANTYAGGSTQTLTANGNGALTIDGVAVAAGNRVLVANEVTGSNNGLYVVTQPGTGGTPYILTRATDMSVSADIQSAQSIQVSEGTVNANSIWILTNAVGGGLVLDTTALTFAKIASVNEFVKAVQIQAQQTTSAGAVGEFVIGRLSGTGTILGAYYVPTGASAPAAGSNNQVLTVNIRNGSGGGALQVAQATLANATPMVAFTNFSLGAITNPTYADGNVLTASTALTGTASLPAGVWVVVSTPN